MQKQYATHREKLQDVVQEVRKELDKTGDLDRVVEVHKNRVVVRIASPRELSENLRRLKSTQLEEG